MATEEEILDEAIDEAHKMSAEDPKEDGFVILYKNSLREIIRTAMRKTRREALNRFIDKAGNRKN